MGEAVCARATEKAREILRGNWEIFCGRIIKPHPPCGVVGVEEKGEEKRPCVIRYFDGEEVFPIGAEDVVSFRAIWETQIAEFLTPEI